MHALELIVEQLAEIKTTLNDIVHRHDNRCENARMRQNDTKNGSTRGQQCERTLKI